jgi:heme exporter protein A
MTQDSLAFTEALTQLALAGLADTPCGLLSAGQQRRVSLLRLLAQEYDVWLLDEPFVSLDAAGIASLALLLQRQLARGGYVLMSSHQPIPFIPAVSQVVAL